MGALFHFQFGPLAWTRYALSTLLCVVVIAGVGLGGVALAAAVVVVIGTGFALDELIGDEPETAVAPAPAFCNANLYLAAPALLLLSVVHMQGVSRTEAWRGEALLEMAAAGALVGYLYALIGATVGHELVHRTQSKAALVSANILLAFTFNTSFTVFHLAGHHRYVATLRDPASARRGESWLAFFVRTVWSQTAMGWRLESARLSRQNRSPLSWRNRVLLGQTLSLALVAGAYGLAGLRGMLAFLGTALIGRIAHELINYVQHYGLVRLGGHPVEARHTWNCKRLVSNALQYNLPRHADHHLRPDREFWQLKVNSAAPTLPYGYQTMAMMALVPPVWRRSIGPRLTEWDRTKASDAERRAIAERGWDAL
uniref:Putative alkane 1-monooxygenase n=1 Tax=uncultured bacterium B7P37metaSE TaxID=670783 RepID=C8CIK0_9BACT|nr:putative alkane 1-monooxygenase [uncultured bacterium B7P37metaSE]